MIILSWGVVLMAQSSLMKPPNVGSVRLLLKNARTWWEYVHPQGKWH